MLLLWDVAAEEKQKDAHSDASYAVKEMQLH